MAKRRGAHRYGSFTPARRAALRKAQLKSAAKRRGHFSRNRGKYLAGAGAVAVGVGVIAAGGHAGYRVHGTKQKISLTKNVQIRTGSSGPLFSGGQVHFVPGKREVFGLKLIGGGPKNARPKIVDKAAPTVSGQRPPKSYFNVHHLYGVSLKGSVGPSKARVANARRTNVKGPLRFDNHGFVTGRPG